MVLEVVRGARVVRAALPLRHGGYLDGSQRHLERVVLRFHLESLAHLMHLKHLKHLGRLEQRVARRALSGAGFTTLGDSARAGFATPACAGQRSLIGLADRGKFPRMRIGPELSDEGGIGLLDFLLAGVGPDPQAQPAHGSGRQTKPTKASPVQDRPRRARTRRAPRGSRAGPGAPGST